MVGQLNLNVMIGASLLASRLPAAAKKWDWVSFLPPLLLLSAAPTASELQMRTAWVYVDQGNGTCGSLGGGCRGENPTKRLGKSCRWCSELTFSLLGQVGERGPACVSIWSTGVMIVVVSTAHLVVFHFSASFTADNPGGGKW